MFELVSVRYTSSRDDVVRLTDHLWGIIEQLGFIQVYPESSFASSTLISFTEASELAPVMDSMKTASERDLR